MLAQEMFEGLQQRALPIARLQNGTEHPLQAAILVAGKAQCLGHIVESPRFGQIFLPEGFQRSLSFWFQGRQGQGSPHEFIVVHSLAARCNPRPRRKVVGVAFTPLEPQQLRIGGIEAAGDLEIFTKLNGR
jgi:hypothetical protein